jgi:hypothetical protein
VLNGKWENIGSGGYGYVYLTELDGFGTVAVKQGTNPMGPDILIGNRIAQQYLSAEDGNAKIFVRCINSIYLGQNANKMRLLGLVRGICSS